ncbi:chymotrypsin-like elastase family member 2A [Bicyclus anynana]|uniref:Chymotrypsin-like elastase family member 2A n=1 Tax=Bicyclus anynana TaxID=110368 RepID=A0ABM3M009_BICAN|nr:chymotrypsin-like elastase family member 2A [Bicyclus anynana]
MKRSGLYLCAFIIIVEFSVIVYLLAHSGKVVEPNHNPVLLEVYPCRNTKDISVWFEPGLSPTEKYRYYAYVNKAFAAHSVVNLTFDAKVNATFTIKTNEATFSRISLAGGDLFTLRFVAPQEGLGVIVQGLTPGLAPNLIGLTVNDVEFCDNPDVEILGKYALTVNSSQEREKTWQAESHRLMKEDLSHCGRRGVDSELVVDGEATPGAWPWYAALFDSSTSNSKYYCAGTLIANNYVLTAGHCTINRKAENLIVTLGKHDRNSLNYSALFTERKVEKIIVPKTYDMYMMVDDIALLKLEKAPSATAQPACLWRGPTSSMETINGTVVAWGFDEYDKPMPSLQQANMPTVSNAICTDAHPDFTLVLNKNNFCAGYSAQGTSVCNGDGGMGFLVFNPDDQSPGGGGKVSGSWHLRGLLSFSAQPSSLISCGESFAVFTNVDKFREWILTQLDD